MNIYKDVNKSLKLFDSMLDSIEVSKPLYVELNPKLTSEKLFNKYKKVFEWQWIDADKRAFNFRDTSKKSSTTYVHRIFEHKGNQFKSCLKNSGSVICIWDPLLDANTYPRPCFFSMKFLVEKDYVHGVVVFQLRDLLRRMIGNWYHCGKLLNMYADKRNKKVGLLYDFSMKTQWHEEDLYKWKNS